MASNGAIDYIVAFIGNFDWRLNTNLPITSMTDARLDAEHLLLFARFFFSRTARRGLCARVQLPAAGVEPASRQECIRLPLTYYPHPVPISSSLVDTGAEARRNQKRKKGFAKHLV